MVDFNLWTDITKHHRTDVRPLEVFCWFFRCLKTQRKINSAIQLFVEEFSSLLHLRGEQTSLEKQELHVEKAVLSLE